MATQNNLSDAQALSNQVVTLSAKWCEYVASDHHKDRDCHWYISVDYAYGGLPIYQAQHYGYIFHDDVEMPERDTLMEAEQDLLKLLNTAIESQREWVECVENDPLEWDEWQIKQAQLFRRLFDAAGNDLVSTNPGTTSAAVKSAPKSTNDKEEK